MDEEANPPPAKRRKRSTVTTEREDFQGPDVIVRLLDADSTNLGLSHPTVMEFSRLEYLTFNSTKVSYLYVICAAIFDTKNAEITLTHIPTVKSLDDDDDTMMEWPLAEDEDEISKGTYCIIFDTDAGKFQDNFWSHCCRSKSRLIQGQEENKKCYRGTVGHATSGKDANCKNSCEAPSVAGRTTISRSVQRICQNTCD